MNTTTHTKLNSRLHLCAWPFALCCLLLTPGAQAASIYWDLALNTGAWGTATNWSTTSGADTPNPAAAPTTSDTAIFNRASATTTISAGVTAGSITFDTASAAAFTIGTGAADSQTYITAGSSTHQMTSTVNNDQTYNVKLQLGGNGAAATYTLQNESAKKFIFNGSILGGSSSAGVKVLAVTGVGNLDFNRAVTRGGATSLTLTKGGAGTLKFGAASSIGLLTLNGGTIDLAADLTLNDPLTTGTGLNGSGGAITTANGSRIKLAGGTTGGNGMDWGPGASGTITINPAIIDGGTYNNIDFYNTGGGTIILKGANTYSGGSGLYQVPVQVGVNSVGTVGSIVSGAFGTGTVNFQSGANVSSDTTSALGGDRTILNAIAFVSNVALGDATRDGKLTFAGGLNLGAAARTITVNSDVQLNGSFSSPAAASALIKAGSGKLIVNANNGGISFGTGNGFAVTGGTVVASNTAAMGPAGGIITLSSGSSFGTLDLATDTSANAYVLNFGSVAGSGGTVLVNRATSGSTMTHTMGAALLGNTKVNVQKGANVTGTPTLEFSGISLTAGAVGDGTATLNPTTAKISVLSGGITRTGNSAATLTLDGTIAGNTIAGVIANRVSDGLALALTKGNVSTWELSAANTFSGNTKVTGGSLILKNNLALQNSAFDTSGAGTLDLSDASISTLTLGGLIGDASTGQDLVLPANVTSLTLNPGSGTPTYVKNLSGGVSGLTLTKTGAGTQILSGNNPYTGATTVSTGILAIGNKDAISGTSGITVGTSSASLTSLRIDVPDATSTTVGAGKSVLIYGAGLGNLGALLGADSISATWAGNVSLAASMISRIGGGAGGTLTVDGVISGADANAGVLFSRAANSTTILKKVNTYTGDTQFYPGGSTVTLKMGIANAINSASRVLIGSATTGTAYFDLNGFNQSIRALSDTVGGDLVVTNSSLTDDAELKLNPADAQSFNGWIKDGASKKTSIVMAGAGSETFSGVNTYTGGTRIDAGTLTLGHATDTLADTGAVNVNGGTLALGANSDTVGAVTLTSGSITGSGTLTASSYDVRSGSISPILAGSSVALTKSTAGTVTLAGVNSYSGATTISDGKLVGVVGGSCASSAVTVNSGSGNKLGVQITDNTKGWTNAGLTFAAGTTALEFDFTSVAPSASVSPLQVNGDVDFGAVVVNIAGGNLPAGTYPLMTWTGNTNGTIPTTASMPSTRQSGSLSVTDKTLSVTIGTLLPLTWFAGNGTWDITTPGNWTNNTGAADYYMDGTPGDSVVFNDTPGAGSYTVTLDNLYQPLSVTVNNNTANYSITGSGGIGGSSTALIKSGTGSLTLATTNTYGGPLTVNLGTVQVSGSGTLAGSTAALNANGGIVDLGATAQTNGTVTIAGGTITNGTLTGTSYAGQSGTVSANLAGASVALTKTTAGTLTLAGTNTYSGATTISEGTLQAGSSVAFANQGALTHNASGTFDLNGYDAAFTGLTDAGTATITDNSAVAGTSTLTINNAGTIKSKVVDGASHRVALRISNNNGAFNMTNALNTFSGGIVLVANTTNGTRMQAGTITAGAYGAGAITIGEGATDQAGIYFGTASQTLTNDFVVNTTLGTDVDGAFRVDTSGLVLSGTINANLADAQFGGYASGSATVSGQLTGNSGLHLANAKLKGTPQNKTITVTLNNGTANANDYAGPTTLDATYGVLVLGAANQIPNGLGKGNVILNGTLKLGGFNETINGLSGAGTLDGVSDSPTLTLGDGDATGNTFSGVIKNTAGSLSLTKIGNGIQTLSGPNTYSGGTTNNAGTLLVNNTTGSGTGSGTVTVDGGTLGGSGTISGAVTINSGGTLAPGTSIGQLTLSSNLTFNPGSTAHMELTNSLAADKAAAVGAVAYAGKLKLERAAGATLDNGSYDLFDGNGFSGSFSQLELVNWDPTKRVNQANLAVDGTISIATNAAPTAADTTLRVDKNSTNGFYVAKLASDPDSDSLSASISTEPTNGTASVVGGTVRYTPDSGYTGSDYFVYTVTDPWQASDTGGVVVSVTSLSTNALNIVKLEVNVPGTGTNTVTYAGYPSAVYDLERSDSVGAAWSNIVESTAAPIGVTTVQDTNAPPAGAFYRMKYKSGAP